MKTIKRRIKESQLLGKTSKMDYDWLEHFLDEVLVKGEGFNVNADEINSVCVYSKDTAVTFVLYYDHIEFLSVDVKFQKPFKVYLDDIKTISFSIGMRGMISVDIVTKRGSSFGCFLY